MWMPLLNPELMMGDVTEISRRNAVGFRQQAGLGWVDESRRNPGCMLLPPFLQSALPKADVSDAQALALQSIVSHRWTVHPCSAYTGTGLSVGMDWLIKEVAGRLYWSGLGGPTALTELIPQQSAMVAVR